MKRFYFIPLVVLFLAGSLEAREPRSKENTPWLHVEVMEAGEKTAEVKVNLPLSLAEMALKMAFDEGHFEFDDHGFHHGDISVSDLRRVWKEVRAAGDAEFVTIQEDDETIKIYRKGDRIHVDVVESEGGTVKVDLPVKVVDAILGGSGDRLDFEAAIAEIQNMDRGEIVRVQDGDDTVRVWIE